MVKREIDGAVYESSADQEIWKSNTIVHQPIENLEACTQQNQVLRQAGRQTKFGWGMTF